MTSERSADRANARHFSSHAVLKPLRLDDVLVHPLSRRVGERVDVLRTERERVKAGGASTAGRDAEASSGIHVLRPPAEAEVHRMVA